LLTVSITAQQEFSSIPCVSLVNLHTGKGGKGLAFIFSNFRTHPTSN